MRLESRTWFILSLLLFLAAIYFWRRGNEYQIQKMKAVPAVKQDGAAAPGVGGSALNSGPIRLLSQLTPPSSSAASVSAMATPAAALHSPVVVSKRCITTRMS